MSPGSSAVADPGVPGIIAVSPVGLFLRRAGPIRRGVRLLASARPGDADRPPGITAGPPARAAQAEVQEGHARAEDHPRREREYVASGHCHHPWSPERICPVDLVAVAAGCSIRGGQMEHRCGPYGSFTHLMPFPVTSRVQTVTLCN